MLKLPKIGHFNYEFPDHHSSSHLATSMLSEEDKAPEANTTGNTGFYNLNTCHHSDSDADSNLEFSFLVKNNSIPSSWILFENQSTVDVFHNPLTNIIRVDASVDIHCNAATATPCWGFAWSWSCLVVPE